MSKSTAIVGKSGTGKTFVAAHVAKALTHLGARTLLVGCDQKRDTHRAVSAEARPSLMEALELAGYDYEAVDLAQSTVSTRDGLDALELGPSQLIVGHYGAVLDDALHLFALHGIPERYDHIVWDISDDRFDSAFAPLFRWVDAAIAVTDEAVGSLFVLNRMLRAMLIGYSEYQFTARILGVIHNRSVDRRPFDKYVSQTHLFPLLSVPADAALARMHLLHATLFDLHKPSEEQVRLRSDFVKVAELLLGNPFTVNPPVPLPDEDIWRLEAHTISA
jgi:nitrogenase subunit NifH